MKLMLKHTLAVVMVGAALAGACASNPAGASATVPLQVPEPPPRQPIAPVASAPAPQPDPLAAPPSVRTSQTPPAAEGPAATPASQSAPPSQTPTASQTPATTTPGPAPPDLRPAGATVRTLTGPQVLALIERTKSKLATIDRRRLSAGKSADYDSALRFLSQSGEAVKANNLLLAQSSAEKAETLADGLR